MVWWCSMICVRMRKPTLDQRSLVVDRVGASTFSKMGNYQGSFLVDHGSIAKPTEALPYRFSRLQKCLKLRGARKATKGCFSKILKTAKLVGRDF